MASAKAPKPVDPIRQANADAAANRYNIVGPSGSQTWENNPTTRTVISPITGKPVEISGVDQWTQNIELGDSEQRQYDARNQISEELLGSAQGRIGDFDQPFSYNNQGSNAARASFDRQKAFLEPEFAKSTENFEDRMANAGIPVGSEAYNDAMRQHDNDQNFALTQAARDSETMGSQLALSERQQQYNELASALDAQQLQPVQAYGTGGAPIDVSGAFANQQAGRNAAAQASAQNASATNQGLSTAAMAALMFSDERLKDDVEQVGEMPTGEGVYEYHYKWEDDNEPKHTGVMAQEIEENYPDAVATHSSGFKMVNYQKIAQALAA
jgi:hypothetical protein